MQNTQPKPREIEEARKRAEKRFKVRAAQKADAPKAIVEYYATQQAAIDRISALRAQRLASERKEHPAVPDSSPTAPVSAARVRPVRNIKARP
jgi:hypothetical protein